MEGLHVLKNILEQGDYICKLDLKDAYFVFLEQTVKEILTFRIGGFPVRIPLSVFSTWSGLKVVYKINKSASFHPLQIVYKNNTIPRQFSNTSENFGGNNLNQGTVIYPLQNLGFVINLKKSVLHPTQRIEFLGMIIDSVGMTVYLRQAKVE